MNDWIEHPAPKLHATSSSGIGLEAEKHKYCGDCK